MLKVDESNIEGMEEIGHLINLGLVPDTIMAGAVEGSFKVMEEHYGADFMAQVKLAVAGLYTDTCKLLAENAKLKEEITALKAGQW